MQDKPLLSDSTELRAQRMEDVAYTINHALACSATDFIDPFVGNATQKWLGARFSVGCGSDHGHFGGGEHSHHHGNLGHWWLGELAGDFGSVPVTIAIQRHAPRLMDGLRNGLEKVAGGLFRASALRSAKREAAAFGGIAGTTAIQDRAAAIYAHEMQHLPQALVWTASSVVLNVGVQKLSGNTAPLWQVATSKMVGVGFSSALTVGLRALAPSTAQKWDRFASEKIYLPATRKLGAVFGVESEAVERMAEKSREHENKSWVERQSHDKTKHEPGR